MNKVKVLKNINMENLKSKIARVVSKISPSLYFKISYIHNRGKLPALRNPKNISEILISKVLNGEINKYAYLADKYRVREYITAKGYKHLLTPLIACYSSPYEIKFEELPKRFAIKMNFGAGMNIICQDNKTLNRKSTINKLENWLKKGEYSNSEQHYNLIERRIVIEEYIDDGTGGFPIDYKFMCIRGKVFCILGCSERETGHTTYAPFDINWNYIQEYDKMNRAYTEIPRPNNLEEMIKIAEDISKDFDFIRVDLYSNGTKIWFGELTLTPSGCILHGWSQKAIDDMGEVYRKSGE